MKIERTGPGWSEPLDAATRVAAGDLAGRSAAWGMRDVAAQGGRVLPEPPPHIARLNGLSAGAKLLWAIVAERPEGIRRDDVWRRIGQVNFELAESEWGEHLDALLSVGLVARSSMGLVALRRVA